ncbi:teichuronic acid biosynthesis protein TuaB [Lachnospiraceae bacterium]|nr:teichuronic acid biosynthesis protein TuaB [Lachnospiraceae bacterium]
MDNIKSKVFSGLVWTYAERMLAQLVSLAVTVILARIIEPGEYGIISLVLVFITLANVVVSDGFGNALIQKKDADDNDFSSMLYFSLLFGIILYFCMFFSAVFISDYYQIEELVPVIRIFSLKIPIAAVNSIQHAFVSKRMEFKKFFFATLSGTITSGIVGIFMAYRGFGVWALVAQYLTNSVIDTVCLAFTIRWKPALFFSWHRVKVMLGFGTRVLVVSFMMALYTNIRNLIIGKKFSVEDLSYCNKGQQFPSLISVNVNTSITKVLFPALSSVQNDLVCIKAMTRRAIRVGTFLLSPLLIGLAAVGPTFISVLLTEKWLPCVPYLRIMCIVYLLQPIQTASLQAMKALGESKIYLRLEIIRWSAGILILIVSVAFFYDVYVVMFSALLAEIVSTFINWPANKKILNYKYKEQLNDIIGPLIISTIMYAAVAIEVLLPLKGLFLLIVQIGTGGLVYIILSMIFKLDSFEYVINIFKPLMIKLKKKG